MSYEKDTGPLDALGKRIEIGNRIVIAANQGVRVGEVLAVKSHECQDWQGDICGYTYSITVDKEIPKQGRQTFQHDTMGEAKFWVMK